MNKEENYVSGSDESDEDFCPESGGEESIESSCSDADSDAVESDEGDQDVKRRKKSLKKTNGNGKQTKTRGAESDTNTRRQTRNRQNNGNVQEKGSTTKDDLASDEELDTRNDALWADFLNDVKPPVNATAHGSSKTESPTGSKRTSETPERALKTKSSAAVVAKVTKANESEIADCNEPESEVRRLPETAPVAKAEDKSNALCADKKIEFSPSPRMPLKRPALGGSVGGGLGSLLNQMGKKKKLSVLERSKEDWKTFKQDEGIEEQLQTFNKGRNGYLERQDFLERTDLRQFEIERQLRRTSRQNN